MKNIENKIRGTLITAALAGTIILGAGLYYKNETAKYVGGVLCLGSCIMAIVGSSKREDNKRDAKYN